MLLFSSRQKKTFLRKHERCTKRSISPILFEGRVALRPIGKFAYDSHKSLVQCLTWASGKHGSLTDNEISQDLHTADLSGVLPHHELCTLTEELRTDFVDHGNRPTSHLLRHVVSASVPVTPYTTAVRLDRGIGGMTDASEVAHLSICV